jgi:hypothetical protein
VSHETTITVSLEGHAVSIKISGPEAKCDIQLHPEVAVQLAALLLERAKDYGRKPAKSLLRCKPLLWFVDPAVEIGADDSGRIALGFQSFCLSPFIYSVDDEAAKVIVEGIKEVSGTPHHLRFQKKKH